MNFFNIIKTFILNKYITLTKKIEEKTNDLSIQKKVFLAPVVSIMFIFLMGIIFFVGLIQQKYLIGDIVDKRFRLYQQSSEIVQTINIINSNMYKGFVWSLTGYDRAKVDDFLSKQMPMADELIVKIKKILESEELEPNERRTFISVLDNIEEFKKRAAYAKDSALLAGDVTTASVILQMGDDQFWILYDSLKELMKIEDEISRRSFHSSQSGFQNFSIFTIIFVIIALAVSIILSISIASVIVTPVNRIIQALRENTSWNIDPASLERVTSRDEIGEFAKYFREYITEIKTSATALEETRDQLWGEMELAKKIQRVLLPAEPVLHGYDVAVNMTPADEVGGDYYDIINIGGADWIVIGDVSGHGVPAGLVMMMLQTSIKTVLNRNPDITPSQLLIDINRVLTANIRLLGEDKFVTITILACFPGGKFIYSGLHEDIMIYRANNRSVDIIKTKGMWLGIKDDISEYTSDDELVVENGDVLLLYTDGITEAFDANRKIFSKSKLKNILEYSGHKSSSEIKDLILEQLDNYKKHDDVTMIILRRI